MKLEIGYSQKLFYTEVIEVSDKDYEQALEIMRDMYEEGYCDIYDTFDEFLKEYQYILLQELDIEYSCDVKYAVDGSGIEDECFTIIEEEK